MAEHYRIRDKEIKSKDFLRKLRKYGIYVTGIINILSVIMTWCPGKQESSSLVQFLKIRIRPRITIFRDLFRVFSKVQKIL